jgi:hypothetical protein
LQLAPFSLWVLTVAATKTVAKKINLAHHALKLSKTAQVSVSTQTNPLKNSQKIISSE